MLNNKHEPGIIYGFARLRLPINSLGKKYRAGNKYFPELEDACFLRELHVYGQVASEGEQNSIVQHHGIGKVLVATAEEKAKEFSFNKMVVIAGIGVKKYYQKLGYQPVNTYMIKQLDHNILELNFYYSLIGFLILLLAILWF